jgi:predicted DsbA family dithiol-disulfide isomerase
VLTERYGAGMTERIAAMFTERALPPYAPPPEIVPNSRTALRLGELAREHGAFSGYHARVMDAYWAESLDIGDHAVLRELAAEAGLPGVEVEDVLTSSRYLDVVETSTRRAARIGASGVPAFLLDGRLLVVGAQPDEVFEQAFGQLEHQHDV